MKFQLPLVYLVYSNKALQNPARGKVYSVLGSISKYQIVPHYDKGGIPYHGHCLRVVTKTSKQSS